MKHLYLKKFANDILLIDDKLKETFNRPYNAPGLSLFSLDTMGGQADVLANAVMSDSPNKKQIRSLANNFGLKHPNKALLAPLLFIGPAPTLIADAVLSRRSAKKYNELRKLVAQEKALDLSQLKLIKEPWLNRNKAINTTIKGLKHLADEQMKDNEKRKLIEQIKSELNDKELSSLLS